MSHAWHARRAAGGDDFKSGQTKMKSVLVDFLVGAGIKPTAIVSYNHLGNNDGMNLSAPQTFRSKEISKSNVVDDMVRGTPMLCLLCQAGSIIRVTLTKTAKERTVQPCGHLLRAEAGASQPALCSVIATP